MPKKLHNIYAVAIYLLGVLPCVVSALLWVPGLLLSIKAVADFELTKISKEAIFYVIAPWVGLTGTMIIKKIFKYVFYYREVPLKKIYQGLAISPFVMIIAYHLDDFFNSWGIKILLLLPTLSLFVAMLYNRSWAKHQGVVLDAH